MKPFLICLIFLFCGMQSGFAQKRGSSDSVLSQAEFLIYKDPDASLKILNQTLKTETDPARQVKIHLLIANAYLAKRDFDKSLKAAEIAKSIVEKTNNPEQNVISLNTIAVLYQQMGLYSKSLALLDESDALIVKIKRQETANFQRGKNYAIRGMIYRNQENPELALEKFKTALGYFSKAKSSKPKFANMSIVSYNIGNCFIELEKLKDAATSFKKSYLLANEIEAKSLEAYALKGLAETLTLEGDYSESIKLLNSAEDLSAETKDLTLNEGIYNLLANNYLALNNTEKYQFYNVKYKAAKFEREQNELLSINQTINNNIKETELKTDKTKAQYRLYTILIFGFSFLCGAAFLWYIRKKRLSNKKIREEIQMLLNS